MNVETPVVLLAPGPIGHPVARTLGRLGVPVYGVHGDPSSPAARSRYWRASYYWDLRSEPADRTVARLMDLGRCLGCRPVLLTTDDNSCLMVADHADVLRDAYLLPDTPPGLIQSLTSKRGLYSLCKEHGFPTPETDFPASRQDVESFACKATFPVMLKGVDTQALRRRAGVAMVICPDADTLLRRYDELETPGLPSLMLQEFIPGGTEAVWMFEGYFNASSCCLFSVTGRKLRQFPAYTGATCLGECVRNEPFAQRVRGFMQSIGYRGILDSGFMYDARTGEYKLLDVNPRVGLNFRQFVDRSGMDVVRALYLDLTGQSVPTGAFPQGRKWIIENFDLLSAVRYWRDGKLTIWDWLTSYRGVEEASWFAQDDLMPWAAMWWQSARLLTDRLVVRKPAERPMSASW